MRLEGCPSSFVSSPPPTPLSPSNKTNFELTNDKSSLSHLHVAERQQKQDILVLHYVDHICACERTFTMFFLNLHHFIISAVSLRRVLHRRALREGRWPRSLRASSSRECIPSRHTGTSPALARSSSSIHRTIGRKVILPPLLILILLQLLRFFHCSDQHQHQ